MSSIRIIKSDITKVRADAIVNAANEHLARGGGVCGALFAAAGSLELEEACRKIGYCDTGSAVITPAFGLDAKFIIHAVGPVWTGGEHGEPRLLRSAYQKALQLARFYQCRSIAFPLISAGIFGYPEEDAWREAMRACREFDSAHPGAPLEIIFAVRTDAKLEAGRRSLAEYALSMSAESKTIVEDVLTVGNARANAVYFLDPEGPSGCLSNWFPCRFRIGDMQFSSVEQYLMYRKCTIFGDMDAARAVMATDEPREQQRIGRNAAGELPRVWEGVRQTLLIHGQVAKFSQNEELKELLLGTGNAWLVECAASEEVWTCGFALNDPNRKCADLWRGRNITGFALMEARKLIRSMG